MPATPETDQAAGFDRADFSLPSLPVEMWNGFIFTTFNAGPPPQWDDVRDAAQFCATSLQVPKPGLNPLVPDLIPDEPQDKDCLCLNIWTPAADGA